METFGSVTTTVYKPWKTSRLADLWSSTPKRPKGEFGFDFVTRGMTNTWVTLGDRTGLLE